MTEQAYIEVGLKDGIRRRRQFSAEDRAGAERTKQQYKQRELPEDLMEELSQYLGDGNAKVVVGAELTHSRDYGCKAGAFVTVSVTCNSDSQTIQAVHDIIMPAVKELAKQDLVEIAQERDDFMDHGGVSPRVVESQPAPQVSPVGRPPVPPFRR